MGNKTLCKPTVNQRELILDMLLEILENGAFSHIVIGAVLDKYAYLPKEERAFLTRVVSGVIERKLTLDYILDRFSRTPVRKMKPVIRTILRSAVYQIVYLDGVPNASVVDESVKLAKKRGFKGLQGFVNGVLRSIARSEYAQSEDHGDALLKEAGWEIRYSMPQWIIDLWLTQYPKEDVERMLVKFLEVPETTAWYLAEDAEGTGADRIRVCDYRERPEKSLVQDVSSMQAARMTQAGPGRKVLDCCASPGGKSLYMAAMGADVTSCDISEAKAERIRENAEKMGLSPDILVRDASVFYPEFEGAFDIVLADVPCSGLGVLARKPEIKYSLTSEKIEALVRLQHAIVDNVKRYVNPNGGVFVYSTCTVGTPENDVGTLGLGDPEYEEQRLPGRDPGDGFYIARWTFDQKH